MFIGAVLVVCNDELHYNVVQVMAAVHKFPISGRAQVQISANNSEKSYIVFLVLFRHFEGDKWSLPSHSPFACEGVIQAKFDNFPSVSHTHGVPHDKVFT